jgi:hypothetical protein
VTEGRYAEAFEGDPTDPILPQPTSTMASFTARLSCSARRYRPAHGWPKRPPECLEQASSCDDRSRRHATWIAAPRLSARRAEDVPRHSVG